MNSVMRYALTFIVPVMALVYGIGDNFKWWDSVRGRTAALVGWRRLATQGPVPRMVVCEDDPEFCYLHKFIIDNTENNEVIKRHHNGIKPTCILRVGGWLQADIGKGGLPEDYPDPRFIPESAPILFVYNYSPDEIRLKSTVHGDKVLPIGSLGDIRRWIQQHRNQERFVVTTILIGILSIVVTIIELTRSKSNKQAVDQKENDESI